MQLFHFFHFQSWHKQGCFTCKDCNKSLDSNTVAERKAEDGDVVPGTPESAPKKFSFARAAQINTVVATVVFGIVWLAIRFDVFGVGEFAAAVNR